MSTIEIYRQERESEYIEAEVVYEPALEGGAIVKGFLVAGRIVETIVEAIVGRFRRMLRFGWRNLRSFGFWLRELAENAHFKFQMRRIARKGRERKQRQRINFAVFDYIREGAVAKLPVFIAWLFHTDGKSELADDKFEYEHRSEQAKALLDDDAFKKRKAARKIKRATQREHNIALAYRFVPIGAAAAGEWYCRPSISAGPVVLLFVVLGAVGTLYFGVTGRKIVRAREGVAESFPSINKIDSAHLERAFDFINVSARCLPPGVIETEGQTGWTATLVIQPTKPVKTVSDNVLTSRRQLATVMGGLDESQIILTKAGSEDRVHIRCSYTKPSQNGPSQSPYASMQTVDTLSRVHIGSDALNTLVTFRNGYATLIVGTSGTGKSELLYSFAAPVALHPRGVLLTTTFKKASNLTQLLAISNGAVVGDEASDRQALADGVRLINEYKAMGSQRKALMAERGISEVTDEMLMSDPDFPPILLIVDEAQYLIDEHAEMRKFVMALAHSIRHTGMKMVFTTQQLSKSVINQDFAQAFTTRVIGKVAALHEVNALAGGSAIRNGYDTTEWDEDDKAGRCVLIGDAGGLKECRAHHWTDSLKDRLAARSLVVRGDFPKIDLDPKPSAQATAEAFAMPKASRPDMTAQILAIRDKGTFGDKGVWSEEYPKLCELLGIDVDTLKTHLQAAGVDMSRQIAKDGANKRGFRFDQIKQPKEQS